MITIERINKDLNKRMYSRMFHALFDIFFIFSTKASGYMLMSYLFTIMFCFDFLMMLSVSNSLNKLFKNEFNVLIENENIRVIVGFETLRYREQK